MLEALTALGPAAFTPAQVESVRDLADGDRRMVGAGLENRIIQDDERFRAAARSALQALTTGAPLRDPGTGTAGRGTGELGDASDE